VTWTSVGLCLITKAVVRTAVDFACAAAVFFNMQALMGPSGAGKSTLMVGQLLYCNGSTSQLLYCKGSTSAAAQRQER
jgi:ABC-type lipoprotein export system ATPase subunit